MIRLLLILLLLPYPYALSLSTSEATRGQTVVVTVSAPAGSAVALNVPLGVSGGPLVYLGGDTWRADLHIAAGAPVSRQPRDVVLLIDGRAVARAPLRIWTEAPRLWRVALPIVRQ